MTDITTGKDLLYLDDMDSFTFLFITMHLIISKCVCKYALSRLLFLIPCRILKSLRNEMWWFVFITQLYTNSFYNILDVKHVFLCCHSMFYLLLNRKRKYVLVSSNTFRCERLLVEWARNGNAILHDWKRCKEMPNSWSDKQYKSTQTRLPSIDDLVNETK